MNISFAFRSMLAMLTSFFSAGEKIGKTLDNLATVAEETSGVYVDEARAERQAKIAAREQAALAIATAAAPAPAKAKATAA
jgi:hypothetical protein